MGKHPKPSSTLPDFTGRVLDGGRYHLQQFLGSGAYGAVYRGLDLTASAANAPSPQRAIKILRKTKLTKGQALAIKREIRFHRKMTDHPNVVTLHRAFEDTEYVYLVLEYCPGGTLFDKICQDGAYWKNDVVLKKAFIGIIDAVSTCHQRSIFHRDLKPENILVSEDGSTSYLADFGLATDECLSKSFGCGSTLFMSPECLGTERDFQPFSTPHNDLWALGIILINMISSRSPWAKALSTQDSFKEYLNTPNFLRQLLPISQGACDILTALLNPTASKRTTLPALREAIIGLDTFFMTDEDLACASETVQLVTQILVRRMRLVANEPKAVVDISPRMVRNRCRANLKTGIPQSVDVFMARPVAIPAVAPALPPRPKAASIVVDDRFVINNTESSAVESEGPITPETFPVNPAVEVSELGTDIMGTTAVNSADKKSNGPLIVVAQQEPMIIA